MGDKFLYIQESGKTYYVDKNGKKTLLCTGYSGKGIYKNKPEYDNKKDYGPCPSGEYSIGSSFTHEITGVITMRLSPVGHNCKQRNGMMIHGDNADHTASQGCIILPRNVRKQIRDSKCKKLIVKPNEKNNIKPSKSSSKSYTSSRSTVSHSSYNNNYNKSSSSNSSSVYVGSVANDAVGVHYRSSGGVDTGVGINRHGGPSLQISIPIPCIIQ